MKKTDKVEGNSIGQGLLWMSGVFTGLCSYSFRLCTFLLTSRIATLALARTHLQCWSRRPTIRQKRWWRRKRCTARSGLLRQLRLYRICCCYSCLYLHEQQKWSADPFEPKRLPRAVSNRPFASRLLCAQTPPLPAARPTAFARAMAVVAAAAAAIAASIAPSFLAAPSCPKSTF